MRVAPAATTRCRYDTYILAGLPLAPQAVAQLAAASYSGGSEHTNARRTDDNGGNLPRLLVFSVRDDVLAELGTDSRC